MDQSAAYVEAIESLTTRDPRLAKLSIGLCQLCYLLTRSKASELPVSENARARTLAKNSILSHYLVGKGDDSFCEEDAVGLLTVNPKNYIKFVDAVVRKADGKP